MAHCFLLSLLCIITVESLTKQVILTPNAPSNAGASVAVIGATGEVTSSSTTWDVTSQRLDTWHLVVDLDKSWGFDPIYESNITFEMDGVLVDNLIFAFTTPKLDKYIAIRIRDTYSAIIVPNVDNDTFCPLSGSASLVVGNVSTVLKESTQDRWRHLGLFTRDTSDILRNIQGSGDTTFPIKFTLINKPNLNSLHLIYASGGTIENYVEHCFYEAFDTNQGLQIYFAVDDSAVCTVNSITVTYSSAAAIISTGYPTDGPMISTTSHPIKYPTAMPTTAPSPDTTTNALSKFPSKYPIIMPSKTPSGHPSESETSHPNESPTKYPSKSPTLHPDDIETSRTNDSETQTETDNVSWKTITILFSIIIGLMLMFCCFYIMYILLREKSKSNALDLSQLQLQSMSHDSCNDMATTVDDHIETVAKHIHKPSNNDVLDEVEGGHDNGENEQPEIETNTRRGDENEFVVEGSSDEGEDDHVTVR